MAIFRKFSMAQMFFLKSKANFRDIALTVKMPFVRHLERQFERGKKGQLISKKFSKNKVFNKTLKKAKKNGRMLG